MPRPPTPTLSPYTEQLPDVNSPATWATRTPLFWNWVTGPGYDNFADLLNYSESAIDFIDAALAGSDTLVDAVAAIQALGAKPIGEPFGLWDHLVGCPIPSNAGTAKFIKLTAGLMGVGAYNEGLLGSESVTGTAPLVTATANILVGPMTGQTVHLINTEEAFLRARSTSGALQQDQMQRITGRFGIRRSEAGGLSETTFDTSGAIANGGVGVSNVSRLDTTDTASGSRLVTFDSASSPDARTSSTTSGETRTKNVSATFYLRIA